MSYPYKEALAVAKMIVDQLEPYCCRLEIAGSLRRHKEEVGDVEIVYVPLLKPNLLAGDLLPQMRNMADLRISDLESLGVLGRRKNINGVETYGPKNKYMVHCASGIPVDLFATELNCWSNYLVCRTGGVETNRTIAMRAQEMGWRWNPYGEGFSKICGKHVEIQPMGSEEDVFSFVGMSYKEPWERQ